MIYTVPQAKDCMSTVLYTVTADQGIFDALDMLLARRTPGAPVLDNAGKLVGILSEKDCLRVLTNDTWDAMVGGKVRDYMSEIRERIEPNMDLFAAAHRFLNCNFASLPVIDGEELVGVITRRDVLRGIKQFQLMIEKAKKKEEHDLKVLQRPSSIDEMQQLARSQKRENLAALFSQRRDEDGPR